MIRLPLSLARWIRRHPPCRGEPLRIVHLPPLRGGAPEAPRVAQNSSENYSPKHRHNIVAASLRRRLRQSLALGDDARHLRHVLSSPSTKWHDSLSQATTERGQRVVHARRHLLVVSPHQHVIGLQILQLLDQHLVADARNQAFEFAVTLRAIAQEKQDQRFPLARDDAERGVEPAGEVAGTDSAAGFSRSGHYFVVT